MAKRRQIAEVASGSTGIRVGNDLVTVSAELGRNMAAMRQQVIGFGEEFSGITRRKADMVKPLNDLFKQWVAETGRRFYIDFVRALDNSVPADRTGYRAHPTYQGMEYLKRSFDRAAEGRTTAQPTRANAVGKMARLLKTILAVIQPDDLPEVWRAIGSELQLEQRQLDNLKKAVAAVQPVGKLDIKRKVKLEIVHQEVATAAA